MTTSPDRLLATSLPLLPAVMSPRSVATALSSGGASYETSMTCRSLNEPGLTLTQSLHPFHSRLCFHSYHICITTPRRAPVWHKVFGMQMSVCRMHTYEEGHQLRVSLYISYAGTASAAITRAHVFSAGRSTNSRSIQPMTCYLKVCRTTLT